MKVEEMNNCLSKFYLSARRNDGSYHKKTSLLSIRAALDRKFAFTSVRSPCDAVQFNEGNKALNSYLKHLASSGKIAGTVPKNPLTAETVQKLFEAGELASAETRNPRLLLQTTWFYISLYFGNRGRENQSAMKQSMLRLAVTPSGEEYFELNKYLCHLHPEDDKMATVIVLSSNNVETRQIKAVAGHKSDTNIESYCARPTLNQFKSMSSALTSFIHGSENVKTRHQRPLHPIQPQVQQLSHEIQPKESSQCQPTACPLVKTKKTFSSLTELIHKPFCHQGISKDAHSLSTSI